MMMMMMLHDNLYLSVFCNAAKLVKDFVCFVSIQTSVIKILQRCKAEQIKKSKCPQRGMVCIIHNPVNPHAFFDFRRLSQRPTAQELEEKHILLSKSDWEYDFILFEENN